MKKQLEDLPNEVVWSILEYMSPIDAFVAFFDLNQRFNQLLRSAHFRSNLQYVSQTQYNYYLRTILPNIELAWIESLSVDDITNRLDSIRLSCCLRSLTLQHLRTESINNLAKHILPKLKQLKRLYLHSEYVLKDEDVNCLSTVIFSEKIASLTHCQLAFQEFGCMNFNHLAATNRNITLKTLIIDQWCRLNDFTKLLVLTPNIRRLTVRLFVINPKA